MEKIEVRICTGSSCYTKGRENLKELHKIVPEKYGDKVVVTSALCFGICSIKWEDPKAPYAKVDDEIIEQATVEKILEAVDKKLQA